jgi:hypothetical protein
VSEDSPDKMEYSRRSRARACLRASKRGNFVGNQRFLKRYVGRKTKGDNYLVNLLLIKSAHFEYKDIRSGTKVSNNRCNVLI